MRSRTRSWSFVAVVVVLVATVGYLRGAGQQTVPFQNGIPVAPLGLSGRPLPALPVVIDTAEGMRVRVSVVARGLENPWSIAFLPDGAMLVTERAGRLRIIRNGVLDPQPVAGGPMAYGAGVSGLPGAVHGYMDVTLHPKFAQNRLIYLSYTKARGVKQPIGAIARGRWDGKGLVDMKEIFVTGEGEASAMRLAFGRDDTLYVTTTGATPQDPNTLAGKVLRLADDGSI
ncbi:MAG TPA: PQQ-dependent sugar dehydrogenase, partial [Vicinamibacterales bacterium]